ncbi:hypothetical protein LSTR_LSTR008256 [Laodelphax striatellus]|uniref:Uncharacterized protein n=1 Tax=Laodelphax striatellus TaxID=195883 RepID=A0A482XLA2_LAOST|nr:hypothetical protein LSTR_LSTR008256 [Laodelphax striatellus]
MSMSKSILRCRRCACLATRHFSSHRVGSSEPIIENGKLNCARSKGMSFNQWKIINQFKELLWKRNPEWAIMYIVNKEWINLLRKFPRATGVFHSVSVQRKSHHGNLTPSNQSKTDSISIESAEQKLNEPL